MKKNTNKKYNNIILFLVFAFNLFMFILINGTNAAMAAEEIVVTQAPAGTSIESGTVNPLKDGSGRFVIFNYTTNQIIRYNSDNTVDSTFNPALPSGISARMIAVQSDGKVLVVTNDFLFRLNADGSMDDTFGSSGSSEPKMTSYLIRSVAIQSDGKIVVTEDNGNGGGGISYYRLNSDGTLDTTFCVSSNNVCYNAMAFGGSARVHNGNQLVLSYQSYVSLNYVVTILDSFGERKFDLSSYDGYRDGGAYNVQADGKILFEEVLDSGLAKISRLNADGTPDLSFNTESAIPPYAISIYSDSIRARIVTNPNGDLLVLINNPAANEYSLKLLDSNTGSLIDSYDLPNDIYTNSSTWVWDYEDNNFLLSRCLNLNTDNNSCDGGYAYDVVTINDITVDEPSGTDSDQDGTIDAIEEGGPNNGDINNDGIKDKDQKNVKSIINSVTGAYGALVVDSKSCQDIQELSYLKEDSNYPDADYDYKLGLHNFKLKCENPGETAKITIVWDRQYNTNKWKYRKYNSLTKQYTDISSLVSYGEINTPSGLLTTATYGIQDGGSLDEDTKTDGIIIDPSGPVEIVENKNGSITLAKTGQSTLALVTLSTIATILAIRFKTKQQKQSAYKRR